MKTKADIATIKKELLEQVSRIPHVPGVAEKNKELREARYDLEGEIRKINKEMVGLNTISNECGELMDRLYDCQNKLKDNYEERIAFDNESRVVCQSGGITLKIYKDKHAVAEATKRIKRLSAEVPKPDFIPEDKVAFAKAPARKKVPMREGMAIFCSDDPDREALSKRCAVGGFLYASNGPALVRIPHEPTENPVWYNSDGTISDCEYKVPGYEQVITFSQTAKAKEFVIDVESLRNKLHSMMAIWRNNTTEQDDAPLYFGKYKEHDRRACTLFFYEGSKEVGVHAANTEGSRHSNGAASYGSGGHSEYSISLTASLIGALINCFYNAGFNTVTVAYRGSEKALCVTASEAFSLLMPRRVV